MSRMVFEHVPLSIIERLGATLLMPETLIDELNAERLAPMDDEVQFTAPIGVRKRLSRDTLALRLNDNGDWQLDPQGPWLALVSFSVPREEHVLRRLYKAADTPGTGELNAAKRTALNSCLNTVLTTLDEGDCYFSCRPLLDVDQELLDTPEALSSVPPVVYVMRHYLLLVTPSGTQIVVDTPLSPDAAAHYVALGWRVMRASVDRSSVPDRLRKTVSRTQKKRRRAVHMGCERVPNCPHPC
jgi:hypothetical protein